MGNRPLSPISDFGTLLHVHYSEPCLPVTPLHLATVTCPSPAANRQGTEVICPLIYNARPVTFNEGVAALAIYIMDQRTKVIWHRSTATRQRLASLARRGVCSVCRVVVLPAHITAHIILYTYQWLNIHVCRCVVCVGIFLLTYYYLYYYWLLKYQ